MLAVEEGKERREDDDQLSEVMDWFDEAAKATPANSCAYEGV